MNLTMSWSAPSPAPNCGYKAQYRRKGDPSYTEVDVSGTTLIVPISAPASYEGVLTCDCCSDALSTGTLFGVNGYSPLTVTASVSVQGVLTVTITSLYGNPYDMQVGGSLRAGGTLVGMSVAYPANSTNFSQIVAGTYASNAPITQLNITAINPYFDNGGQLQKFDSVNTPPYFKFYWVGDVSGTTWTGAPTQLPSFTLDSFIITQIDPDDVTILAGTLNVSYIMRTAPTNSFTTAIIEVIDPIDMSIMGSATVSGLAPYGVRGLSINIVKSTAPINKNTDFLMKVYLPSLQLLDSKLFHLPI